MSEQQHETTTASGLAKQRGLPSLKAVSDMTGINSQTLIEWHKNRPQLFEVVLDGCVARSRPEQIGVEPCPCGQCSDFHLKGIGRFNQGSGFNKADADLIAALLNQHRASAVL